MSNNNCDRHNNITYGTGEFGFDYTSIVRHEDIGDIVDKQEHPEDYAGMIDAYSGEFGNDDLKAERLIEATLNNFAYEMYKFAEQLSKRPAFKHIEVSSKTISGGQFIGPSFEHLEE